MQIIRQKNSMDIYIFMVSRKRLLWMLLAIYNLILLKSRIIHLALKLFSSWLMGLLISKFCDYFFFFW